ncbi:esterase-like activity of phytase family protein [Rurimicrobium arvi]|uniref:Phytase-like domain-containing protein n=1 Tax=Rurimicrobium arvi TaxID=2049916 RepID=A0ABP8MI03_9BACT
MKKPAYALTTALSALMLCASCSKKESAIIVPQPSGTSTQKISGATVLGAPVAEAKVYKLMPGYNSSDNFEASGVYYLNGYFYVVCDNRYKIAKIKSTLPVNSSDNTMLSSGSGDSGFEAITYDSWNTPNFFVAEEAVSHNGSYQPRIREYDADMNYQSSLWAEYYFTSANSNKGFEGIAWLNRGGDDYILGLVEGTGKIPVLKKTSTKWEFVTEITLPASVTFSDYSDITLYGNKIAITSQEDGQFWVGTLSTSSWSITGGTAYELPKGSSSGVVGAGTNFLYANIEGISFISDTQVVLVSDKAKSDQPSYQTYKDQSVHIFNLQ